MQNADEEKSLGYPLVRFGLECFGRFVSSPEFEPPSRNRSVLGKAGSPTDPRLRKPAGSERVSPLRRRLPFALVFSTTRARSRTSLKEFLLRPPRVAIELSQAHWTEGSTAVWGPQAVKGFAPSLRIHSFDLLLNQDSHFFESPPVAARACAYGQFQDGSDLREGHFGVHLHLD